MQEKKELQELLTRKQELLAGKTKMTERKQELIALKNSGGKSWNKNLQEELDDIASSEFDLEEQLSAITSQIEEFTSKNGDINVMYVYYDGFVDSSSYLWGDLGFRPVVCLNSYVELQKKILDFV